MSSVNAILICETASSFHAVSEYIKTFIICWTTHQLWSDEAECLLLRSFSLRYWHIWHPFCCHVIFIYHLNWNHMSGKMMFRFFNWMKDSEDMAVYPFRCIWNGRRNGFLYIWHLLEGGCFHRIRLTMWQFWWPFNGNKNGYKIFL